MCVKAQKLTHDVGEAISKGEQRTLDINTKHAFVTTTSFPPEHDAN